MDFYSAPTDDNPWISPQYKAESWRRLELSFTDSPDWSKAVDIFYNRVYGRFLVQVE